MVSRFRARLWAQALEERHAPAVFTVNTTADSGDGSLRKAIIDANAAAGADQIVFDSAVFATAQTITLTSALPNISQDLTISGTGAKNLTVTRDAVFGEFRIFAIRNVAATLNVNISGMKITNGYCNAVSQTDNGGGIYCGPNHLLSLDGVEVSGNTSTAQGGGIAMDARSRLTITNSTISGNTALGSETFGTPFSGAGGGVYFTLDGSLTVLNSTVDNNRAKISGAGIFVYGESSGTALLRNSTISSNVVTTFFSSGTNYRSGGAGIAVLNNGLAGGQFAITVQNSTITGNSAPGASYGGGIQLLGTTFLSANKITARIESTVVAGNTSSTGPDIFGGGSGFPTQKVTVDYSAIGSTGGFTLTAGPGGTGSNQLNQTFALGALADNGGPTRTHLPTDTKLVDKGSNPGALAADQRGLSRFYDDPGVSGALTVDIGAVEVQPVGVPTATASAPPITAAGSGAQTITVVYADDAGISVGTIGNGDIQVTGPGGYTQAGTFLGSSGSGTSVTATYTVPAPVGGWSIANVGLYTVSMVSGQVTDGTNAVPPGAIGSFQNAIARTIVVDSAADNVTVDAKTTLREAIALANDSYPSNDTITFDPSVFTGGNVITWSLGQMFITDSVTIAGTGTDKLTLSGGTVSRHFNLDGPGTLNVTITNLTMSDGRTKNNFQSERGGSIYNNGENLTLDKVWMKSNVAQQSYGGAIHIQGQGTLTFTNGQLTGNGSIGGGAISALDPGHSITVSGSTLVGNTGDYYGGAVMSSGGGSVTLDRCLLKNNSTTNVIPDDQGGTLMGGGGGAVMVANGIIISGGVLENYTTESALSVTDCLFESNTTAVAGGGIMYNGLTSGAYLRNSTFVNNTTPGTGITQTGGGMIAGNLGAGVIQIDNCTFAYNFAYGGGGIAIGDNDTNALVARSSIFAGNASADALNLAPDVGALGITANNCFFGVSENLTFNGASADNYGMGSFSVPEDAGYDTFGDNGGFTLPDGSKINTLSLLPTSPCINVGSNTLALSSDQRGAGFNRVSGGKPDIGAFELQVPSPPTVSSVVFGDGTNQRSLVKQVVVNFSVPVTFSGPVANAFVVYRHGTGGTADTVGLTASPSSGTAGSVTLTFSGPLTQSGSLIDGFYDLTIFSTQVSGPNGLLDGNSDGVGGDDYFEVGDTTNRYFRLFGDVNGDGFTDNVDLIAYRAANGSDSTTANWDAHFDSNADGFIDNIDFIAFRQRLGQTP